MIQFEALHHARAEIFHQEIAVAQQPAYDLLPLGPLQVEHDALFAGVELAEGRRGTVAQRLTGAHHVAFGGLDLDHLGAKVGHHPGAIRTCDGRGEVDHAHAGQGSCGRFG